MPTYTVTLVETVEYEVTVVAEDEYEAEEAAEELFCQSDDPDAEFGTGVLSREATETTEHVEEEDDGPGHGLEIVSTQELLDLLSPTH
ncbi:hypothetical protein SEA_GREENWEASEL_72 [Streptomyces phage GreenWeasel]|nr:hypothetical protein SEA_GREENWEASEL_72 [Streptomyces phage GreenWeasel]